MDSELIMEITLSGRKLHQIFTHDLQGYFSPKETLYTALIVSVVVCVGYLLDKNAKKNKWQDLEDF